jgi:hypothetical membrane protein
LLRFGPHLAILGSVLFSFLWPLSAAAAGDWAIGRDTLSELGGKENAAAPIFSGACALAGGCLLAFAMWLRLSLPAARRGAPVLGFAALGLVMVGVWNITMSPWHMVATVWFFGSVAVGLAFLAFDMLRAGIMPLSSWTAFVGIAVSMFAAAASTIELAEAVAVGAVVAWGLASGSESLAHSERKCS